VNHIITTDIQQHTGADYYMASMTCSGLFWTADTLAAANVDARVILRTIESATYAHVNGIRQNKYVAVPHAVTNVIARRIVDHALAVMASLRNGAA